MNAIDSFTGLAIDLARRTLARRFASAGIDSAELDARILVGAAVGLDLTGLAASAARLLSAAEALRLEDFAQRRISGEPVARILGVKEFWGLPFKLSASTLVPRPDTEAVVERSLKMVGPHSKAALRLLDIGTGSGAILLALLSELPGAAGIGTDISLDALVTARGNAAALGFGPRAAFVACNCADALAATFDVIVSNPPYIRSSDIARLAAEVRDHDPPLALDGGKDGYQAYRSLIPSAERLLVPGGVLVVEAGQGQSAEVEALMRAAGLTVEGPPTLDLSGIPRAIAARKIPS